MTCGSSATDFALRTLHQLDDAFAEKQEDDQDPDERGRERDVHSDKRRLVSVTEARSDDCRCGQAGHYKPLRATDPEQEPGDSSGEDAQPAESFDQRLRPRLRAFVRGCAVGLRWSPVDRSARAIRRPRARPPARPGDWDGSRRTRNGDAEDHKHGAGQDLRSDETGPEAKRLKSSGWHHGQRRGEPDPVSPPRAIEDYLNRGVEHAEGRTLRQRVRWLNGRSGRDPRPDDAFTGRLGGGLPNPPRRRRGPRRRGPLSGRRRTPPPNEQRMPTLSPRSRTAAAPLRSSTRSWSSLRRNAARC